MESFRILELNFDPFPSLETERLSLRRISMIDLEDMFRLRTDVDAMKYLDKPKVRSIGEIRKLITKIEDGIQNNTAINWGMSLKGQTNLIGTIGYHEVTKEHFRAEIGYMMMPAYWNKGIMSEAMQSILDFGFNSMGLHSILANVNPSNNSSIKLLRKFNFQKEAYFKENYFFEGKFLDTEIYSLLSNSSPT